MQLKLPHFSWLFKKQKTADDNQKANTICDNADQRNRKERQSSFKKLIRCLEDAEEPVTIKSNPQSHIKPISVDTGCIREDSRIRDWLLDSARFNTPPATPHVDPSQKDSAASEAAFSKATTASNRCPCPEDKQEPRPVLAKLIGHAPQPPKPQEREHEHEVLFSRRAAAPPAKAADSRARPERPPAAVGAAAGADAARGDAAHSGARAAETAAPVSPGGGWERGWWPESLGVLVSSPVACTQARRSPMPAAPR
jgi:hypothetical protein